MNKLHTTKMVTFTCRVCHKSVTKKLEWYKSPDTCSNECRIKDRQAQVHEAVLRQTMARELIKAGKAEPKDFRHQYR